MGAGPASVVGRNPHVFLGNAPEFPVCPSPAEIGIPATAVLTEAWFGANEMLIRVLLHVRRNVQCKVLLSWRFPPTPCNQVTRNPWWTLALAVLLFAVVSPCVIVSY